MPSPIGNMLRASMELLQLEVGCLGSPLAERFHPMGPVVTHCWMRSFWEVISEYSLQLVMDYPTLELPRSNDRTIMSIAILLGYLGEALRSINRCRIFLCAIFLSDIASANGWFLDTTRIATNRDHSEDSKYSFPRECPSSQDWMIWHELWVRFCQRDGSLPIHLGRWIGNTH